MIKDLLFIKEFRPIRGCDGEVYNLKDDDLSELPARDGVYIIASPQTTFVYPKGVSKILYIGKANSIRRRLKEHQKHLRDVCDDKSAEQWFFDRYNYMKYHGARVYYYLCRGNQESKDLESWIIWSFYNKFGSMPVGNGARSFSK